MKDSSIITRCQPSCKAVNPKLVESLLLQGTFAKFIFLKIIAGELCTFLWRHFSPKTWNKRPSSVYEFLPNKNLRLTSLLSLKIYLFTFFSD